jgi:hypothetical protein
MGGRGDGGDRASSGGGRSSASPYYMTMINRTGAWAELVAVSMVPLMLVSGLSVLRASRSRWWPFLGLAVTTVLSTGSHNITLLWGTTILLVVLSAILASVPSARRQVTRGGVLRLVGVMLPALLVNAWFLLPDVTYQSMTRLASLLVSDSLRWAAPMVHGQYLLSLGRPASPPRLNVLQLPLLTMAWALAGIVLAKASWRSAWMRVVLVLSVVIAVLTVLMTNVGLILALPGAFPMIQLSYRLESYILLSVCGATIGVLRLAAGTPGIRRLWGWAGVPVILIAIFQAAGQAPPQQALSSSTGDKDGPWPYNIPAALLTETDYAG